jgi:hypothetical protein
MEEWITSSWFQKTDWEVAATSASLKIATKYRVETLETRMVSSTGAASSK